MMAVSMSSSYFPPAAELERIEVLAPGATNRILTVFEEQSKHRQILEKGVISRDIKRADTGQVLAFIIAMTGIIGGFLLLLIGKDVAGLSSVIASIAALLTAFFAGSIIRSRERVKKNKNRK